MKNDILILGDGLLGSEFVKQTSWDSVSRKKNNVDLDEILSIVASNEKSIIVNCIANTDTYSNSKSFASERDVPVHDGSWYTYSKILADGYVENFSNNFLTCRVTHKPNPFPYEKAWVN